MMSLALRFLPVMAATLKVSFLPHDFDLRRFVIVEPDENSF